MFSATTRHLPISRDDDDKDDEKFHFESIGRYNPLMKVPELSPSNPQFSKYFRALPTRFKLPRICNYSNNTNPKYRRGRNRNKKEKKSKNSQNKNNYWNANENFDIDQSFDDDFSFSPMKSSSSHRSSSVPSCDSNKHSSNNISDSKHRSK